MFVDFILCAVIITILLQIPLLYKLQQIPALLISKVDFIGRKLGVTLMLGLFFEDLGFGLIPTIICVALFWTIYSLRHYIMALIKAAKKPVKSKLGLGKLESLFEKKMDALNKMNPVMDSEESNHSEEDTDSEGKVTRLTE